MKNNSYIVYKHTNQINNKIYIGITKHGDNPNNRWRNGFGYTENKKFFHDIVEFGWDNFSHEILAENLSEIEALRLEKEYILWYNSVIEGYNNADSGTMVSENGRKKISDALKGVPKKEESIQKQLDTKRDRYGSERGVNAYVTHGKKVMCIETKDIFANISEAERWCGSCKVGECCNKQRAHAGKHPETGQQLSWQYAQKNDIVTISCEKDREVTQKIRQIVCVENNKIYSSASEASRDTGVAVSNILRVCKKERKTAGKMHWEFKEDN